MSRQVFELETLLQQLIDEHQKLLVHVDKHQAAMKAFDLEGDGRCSRLQEAARIAHLRAWRRKRRGLIVHDRPCPSHEPDAHAPGHRGDVPAAAAKLLKLRAELKAIDPDGAEANQRGRSSRVGGGRAPEYGRADSSPARWKRPACTPSRACRRCRPDRRQWKRLG